MNYEELLKKARKELPQDISNSSRFEIPKIKGHIQGSKTVVTNLFQIADSFHRDIQHIIKYLQRELATPATLDGQRLVLGRKLSSQMINEKIENYANTFVICRTCKKPDTTIKNEDRIVTLKCSACGSKYPVRAKIS